ncbi:PqqD family protein [Microcoleus sp. ZQ-A2]|nr:PqqD family protein [Microcoleus sp. FACHB-1]
MQQSQIQLKEDFLNTQGFKVAEDILFRQVQNEAVLLHIPTGMYYALNETSIIAWEALCNQQPLSSAIENIIAEYDVEYSQVLSDLQAFLQNLLEYGVISQSSD